MTILALGGLLNKNNCGILHNSLKKSSSELLLGILKLVYLNFKSFFHISNLTFYVRCQCNSYVGKFPWLGDLPTGINSLSEPIVCLNLVRNSKLLFATECITVFV